ncbi:MAG TPA: CheR family methyltransferase [Vicinamibacterales bacterium]|nr:CheR family methyltransferase [Vicinamibacterales bacterium]
MVDAEFMVVGIGASAGGIQACQAFLHNVPADSGMAYVVILHLSPDHDSRLAEILRAAARIPVTTVDGRVRVEPDHVYVVSPRQGLTLEDGDLVPSPILRVEERRAPIDIFFRTLADSHQARAACVVLSGTGADGSMGLKRVKERGGVCLVQDPQQAEFSDMPRHALETGLADACLPVEELPSRLISYRDGLDVLTTAVDDDGLTVSDARALSDLFEQLRARTGHDFSNYKRGTMLRRIARRMGVAHVRDLGSYLAFFSQNSDEPKALLRDLLISVTNFFRDAKAFEALERTVIPRLFEQRRESGSVRVWVPAAATGEEAYSIAMLLCEYASGLSEPPAIQIFATDIDAHALASAREGRYTLNDAADVSPERLRRFFLKEGDSFKVRKDLRDLVLFAHHNLVKDPPFSHLDLVSCRNLLIYLNRAAQDRVMDTFDFALEPGGYLFLGGAEGLESAADLFVATDTAARIFQSRGRAARPTARAPAVGSPAQRSNSLVSERAPVTVREKLGAPELHQRLLEKYAAPSILVNDAHEIVHVTDGAAPYLRVAGGEPTAELLRVIRPELRLELRGALHQATQSRRDVTAPRVALQMDGRTVHLDLSVRPVFGDPAAPPGAVLIFFEEVVEADGAAPPAARPVVVSDADLHAEDELRRLRARLDLAVEQFETQTEEFKASNEELQAMNEELRSAAEELETSKEELQSVNEELSTVNQELKIKVDEQAQANSDVQNLINATDIGTVFLDRVGRIKLFTPRAREVFNVIPGDRGRPLEDITHNLEAVDLQHDIDHVLERLDRTEREVATTAGRWYLMRVVPYRTVDDRIDGVVLTFVDITDRKNGAELVRRSEERLRRALAVPTVGVIFFGPDGAILDANAAFHTLSGFERERLLSEQRTWDRLEPVSTRAASNSAGDELRRTGRAAPFEAEYTRPDGSTWIALVTATRLSDTEGVAFIVDVTDRRRAMDALRDADRRKNDFLATLAHELRNPLAPITTSLALLGIAEVDQDVARRARDTIERQVRHMVRLVDDLLEASRITLGKIEMRPEDIDLAVAVRGAVESATAGLSSGRLDVTLDLPEEPVWTRGDPVRLGQAFVNVLNNAIKFTPEGGRLQVTLSRTDEWVCVGFRDSGIGIAPPMLPHIFEMFTQGDALPPDRVQGGLGIGLALVRSLIEGHGGRVWAGSAGAGTGTEVTIQLPVRRRLLEPTVTTAHHRPDLTGRAVIVADDKRDAADSLAALLASAGAEVRVVYNGSDAVSAYRARPASVMFLDIGMPDMDGLAVARAVRSMQAGGQVALVAVTGWGREDDRQATLHAGFDYHITKPPDWASLEQALSPVLAAPRGGAGAATQAHSPARR